MGAKNLKKRKFLIQHPLCCFCGGGAESEEPDHIPSRAMFLNRQWPEGYVFPACVKCNRISRYDELVVSFLSRMYPDISTQVEEAEFDKYANSVNKHFPEIINELKLSSAKKKRLAKKHNIITPNEGTSKDIPLLSLEGKKTNEAVMNFSRKLLMALFYKHTNTILPKSGGIAVMWYSNLQVANGSIPVEVSSFLNENPTLIRNSKNLDEQFNYKFKLTNENQKAVFLISFRSSFFVLGYVVTNKEIFKNIQNNIVMSPY